MIYRIIKRCSNVRLSGLALTVLSPIFMIAYVGIRVSSRGPVIFRVNRIGKDWKKFVMYKL